MHIVFNSKLVFIYIFVLIVLVFQNLLLIKYKNIKYYENNSDIIVRIVKPPVVYNEKIKYFVKSNHGYYLYIKLDRYPVYNVGDYCHLSGKLIQPYKFDEFDYYKYLYSNNIYYSYKISSYYCYEDNSISIFSIFKIKELLNQKIEKFVPAPYSNFMIGILWGDNLSFSPNDSELFVLTGTTHIIAASGFNVLIIYEIINKLLCFIDRKYRDIFIISSLFLYSFLGGFAPPITRAVLMYVLRIITYNLGIPVNSYILFLYSVLIIIIFKPYYIFNISFLLSSLSTLGLIIFPNILKKTFLKTLGDNFITTLSATISTLPITIFVFKQFSLMSVFINSLLLFIIDDLMFITLIGSLLSLCFEKIGEIVLSIGYLISFSFLLLLNILSDIFLKLNLGVIRLM